MRAAERRKQCLSRKAKKVLGRTSGIPHGSEEKHDTEDPPDKTRGEAKSTSICSQNTPWMEANARPNRKPPRYQQNTPHKGQRQTKQKYRQQRKGGGKEGE
jgi:hypothetical protein